MVSPGPTLADSTTYIFRIRVENVTGGQDGYNQTNIVQLCLYSTAEVLPGFCDTNDDSCDGEGAWVFFCESNPYNRVCWSRYYPGLQKGQACEFWVDARTLRLSHHPLIMVRLIGSGGGVGEHTFAFDVPDPVQRTSWGAVKSLYL